MQRFEFSILLEDIMMLRKAVGCLGITIVALLGGCGSTMQIRQEVGTTNCGKPITQKVDGIPFYVKKIQYKQETVRKADVLVVSVIAMSSDKKKQVSVGPPIEIPAAAVASIDEFKLSLEQTAASVDEIKKAFLKWKAIAPRIIDSIAVSNKIVASPVVDSSKTYYINSKVPLAGSASITAKLGADQTLTEATASVEDKTLSTILTAIPTSDLVKTFGAALVEGEKFNALVTVQPLQKQIVLRRIVGGDADLQPELVIGQPGVEFEEKSASASSDKKKAYAFEGSVTPPDSK